MNFTSIFFRPHSLSKGLKDLYCYFPSPKTLTCILFRSVFFKIALNLLKYVLTNFLTTNIGYQYVSLIIKENTNAKGDVINVILRRIHNFVQFYPMFVSFYVAT